MPPWKFIAPLINTILLLSEPGSQTYAMTTDAVHPVMFYIGWCSGREFSVTECSGGILSAGVVTCGQSALGVRCRGELYLYSYYANSHSKIFILGV